MHGREHKTAVVTESAVQATLRRGSQPSLAADEERLMRMRVGAGLPLGARLERLATATDAEIEVLAYEIEAYLVLKERRVANEQRRAARSPLRAAFDARRGRLHHEGAGEPVDGQCRPDRTARSRRPKDERRAL